MRQEISTVLANHRDQMGLGSRFAKQFSLQERRILDSWLAEQRIAEKPDENIWIDILLGSKPFFRDIFETVLKGRWGQVIRDCAEPLDLMSENDLSRDFPILGDQGIRFLMQGLDRKRIEVYAGEKPVLLDQRNDTGVWRIDTKDLDNISVKKADLTDIPSVLICEWLKARPKLREARERLCDLFTTCLANS